MRGGGLEARVEPKAARRDVASRRPGGGSAPKDIEEAALWEAPGVAAVVGRTELGAEESNEAATVAESMGPEAPEAAVAVDPMRAERRGGGMRGELDGLAMRLVIGDMTTHPTGLLVE